MAGRWDTLPHFHVQFHATRKSYFIIISMTSVGMRKFAGDSYCNRDIGDDARVRYIFTLCTWFGC
jgi:hypothetical protein